MKHFLSKNGRTFVRRVNGILMHQNSLNLVVSCNSNEKLMILKRFAWNVLHAICPQKNTINLGKHWLACQPSNALKLNPQVLMTSWSLPLNFSKGQNTFFTHFARITSFLGRNLTQRSLFALLGPEYLGHLCWPEKTGKFAATKIQLLSFCLVSSGLFLVILVFLPRSILYFDSTMALPKISKIVTLHCIVQLNIEIHNSG